MIARILLDILAPILLLVAAGAVMRWKFRIDLASLSKLNLYLFVPAFVFDKVATSSLEWAKMGGIVLICIVQVATLGILVWMIGRVLRTPQKTLAAIALAVMFYNSGNYGLPLAELAYGNRGAAVQTFVLLTQNVLTFTVGLSLAAWAGSGNVRQGLGTILRMPVFPTLAAALLARWWSGGDRSQLPVAIAATTQYLAGGLVPIALITLGAQLASSPRWPRWGPVSLVMFLRLILGPVQLAALLWVFHLVGWRPMDLWPWPAELLVLTAATPTAVNTLLLTMELGGDTDLAADCVFWTTLMSCVTITGWLVVTRVFFGA